MSKQSETLVDLKNKLHRLEKEQSQIEGELNGINNQLEELGISSEIDIDDWIEQNKKELQTMREKFSDINKQIEELFQEYEEKDD